MNYSKIKIKDGVTLHLLKNKFKTDLSVVFFSVPLDKKTITKNALIPAVLKSGTKNYNTFQKITEELEMLYGASFDCGIDKTGDNVVLKFFIEGINDNFLPAPNDNLIKTLNILLDIVFNPLTIEKSFNKKYVETEKKNLGLIINSTKDDKDTYSYERCINIMYKNCGYGISKYGNIADLVDINEINLYENYEKLINTAKIDIFVSGNFKEDKIIDCINSNELVRELIPRNESIIVNNCKSEIKEKIDEAIIVKEALDVNQGKLVIGLDILPNNFEDFRFVAILYNAILGNGVNSKLFQIVREKEGLAYTTKSEYIVQKNNIILRCGIELENYTKTTSLIKSLIKDVENGIFSDEDLRKNKEYILAGIEAIDEEQDSQILFKFGQELSKKEMSLEEYKKHIKEITKKEIVELAKYVQINTIYFLENGGENANN